MVQQHEEIFQQLIDTAISFRSGRVLTTAVQLDLFNRLGTRYRTLDAVQTAAEDYEALRRIANHLAGLGLLEKQGKKYRTSDEAATVLTDEANADARPILRLYHRVYNMWGDLERAVKEGQDITFDDPDNRDWNPDFIAAMEARAQFSRHDMARSLEPYLDGDERILDVGGGSGVFSRELVNRHASASAMIADLPHVTDEAEQYIREAGLTDRVSTKELDLLEDESYGSNFDIVLLSAVLHIFGPRQNREIVRRAAEALKPGGLLVIRDYVLEEDETEPEGATLFALHMFLATSSGDVYTEKQFESWLEQAGVPHQTRISLNESSDLLIGRKG